IPILPKAHPQQLGRLRAHSAGLLEREAQEPLLFAPEVRVQIEARGQALERRLPRRELRLDAAQIARLDDLARSERRAPLDEVLELAHVPGELLHEETFERRGAERAARAHERGLLLDE